jgi:cold shock protein
MRGHIKFWNDDKGYGFIRQSGTNDVFVHFTAMDERDRPLGIGDTVEFETETNSRNGKTQARDVRLIASSVGGANGVT